MTTPNSQLRNSLREAGASEDKARKAAETVAAYENRFAAFDVKLTEVKGDVALIKWMMGLLLVGVLSLVVKAFF